LDILEIEKKNEWRRPQKALRRFCVPSMFDSLEVKVLFTT